MHTLPDTLRDSQPYQVILKALNEQRLHHALLLHGDHLDSLLAAATELTAKLLKIPTEKVAGSADFFPLRPEGKMRFINVDKTRELIRHLQHTAHGQHAKVALIFEADRMNKAAANAFLKTLEEPPAGTYLIMVTSRPYDLLDTIRSRCLNFRLPTERHLLEDEEWQHWRKDFSEWLLELHNAPKREHPLILYGLLTRLTHILTRLNDERWAQEKEQLSDQPMKDEEKDALEVGLRKGLRSRLLAEIEQTARNCAIHEGLDDALARKLEQTTRALEQTAGLLELNLKEEAALETFMLKTMRTWAQN